MDGLKFCSAAVIQFIGFFLIIIICGNWRNNLQRSVRKALGVNHQTKASGTSIFIFVFFMFNFVLLIFEISTLVLNNKTTLLFLITLLIIIFTAKKLMDRLSSVLQPLLLENERVQLLSILTIAGATMFSFSFAIESSFHYGVQSQQIKAQIESIKPARLSSPIMSVKVLIPSIMFNDWTPGHCFFRYDSRRAKGTFDSQKLDLVLQKSGLSLYRALPLAQNNYLKGNFIGY